MLATHSKRRIYNFRFYESLKFSLPSITMQHINHIYASNNYDSTMSKNQEYFWQHFNDDLNSLLFWNYSG